MCMVMLLLLIILTPLTLYIPYVQRRVCEVVITWLNDNPHQVYYEIGGVSLAFPLRLKVQDVAAYRVGGDTLFYMKELSTGLDKIPVFQQYYLIRKLDISDLQLFADDFSPTFGLIGDIKSLSVRNLALDPIRGKLRLEEIDIASSAVEMRLESVNKDTLSDEKGMPWHIAV